LKKVPNHTQHTTTPDTKCQETKLGANDTHKLHVGRPNIGSQERFFELAQTVLASRWLTNQGPLVQELEKRLADYLDVKHCVMLCNGTLALEIATRALGLEGEVILPSFTFIATAHALSWQGITPVFVDIDPHTHNLDPKAVEAAITPRTTGILAVHLWGRSAPIEALQTIADRHGLKLMFDAAHAFGCSHKGTMIGNHGEAEIFSFHATKFFNTFEGGAVCTQDDELAQRIRLMQNFGFEGYDNVVYPGTNGKMPEICAAMGIANFENLEAIKTLNRRNYYAYREALESIRGIDLVDYNEREACNYQYIVIELNEDYPVGRDALIDKLHRHQILARKYFWPGCHRMAIYQNINQPSLPVTEALSERLVVLPTGSAISMEDINRICAVIQNEASS